MSSSAAVPRDGRNDLDRSVERDAKRIDRARREHRSVLAQTAFLGTLGLVLVLPVVVGAYVGRWLDGLSTGYSMRWTLSLIVVGLVVGAVNAWLMIRD